MNNADIYRRQNDKTGLTLFKASYRCLRNERTVKYIMIILSFGICLAAILNKYLPQMAGGGDAVIAAQETAATYINLISGVILVVGLVMGFYTTRMHIEGTVLRDRYDAYVFDNPPNLAILRPISQTIINVYSHKVKKSDEAFRDGIYSRGDEPDPVSAQFMYINKEAHSDYKLYISVQPFFLTLWIGFCVIIIILAVSFNDSFVTTLINIMIPSLSAITTIGNSWYNFRLQMRQLQNLLTVIDQIQRLPDKKRLEYISDKRNMRALADGLYNYRSSPFVIPNFLVRRHLRSAAASTITLQLPDGPAKTEMPTLLFPDMDAAEQEILGEINGQIRTVTFSRTHTVSDVKRPTQPKKYTAKTPENVSAPSPRKRAVNANSDKKADKKPTGKEPLKLVKERAAAKDKNRQE